MCGLFGAAAQQLSDGEVDAVKQLGVLSSFRGIDSTGIAIAFKGENKNTCFRVRRHPINATSFLYHKETEKFLKDHNPNVIAGHCRWATVGSVNKNNTHPFLQGRIIGMHNGTIEAFRPPFDSKKDESDSLLFFKCMAENGVEEALFKARFGAMALVWYDIGSSTLNFFRNEKRPLWKSVTTANTLFWASQENMLEFMHSNTVYSFRKPEMFKINHLYTYPIGAVEPSKVVDLTSKLFPPVIIAPSNKSRFKKNKNSGNRSAQWTSAVYPGLGQSWTEWEEQLARDDAAAEAKDAGFSKEDLVYAGYNGSLYTADKAEKLLSGCCAVCQTKSELKDEVAWFDHDTYVCGECMESDLTKEYLNVSYNISKYIPKETNNEN